jgi:hypothetical protein
VIHCLFFVRSGDLSLLNIPGSRASALFFVGVGAPMMVASTLVPSRNSKPKRTSVSEMAFMHFFDSDA